MSQATAIFGNYTGGTVDARTLNSGEAQDGFDWNAILSNGIRGAAQAAMSASVSERYRDGQLINARGPKGGDGDYTAILIIAVIAYLVFK